jgi:endonuclease/exonuclease/phosphatase family metal-dependent hydrolase
MGRSMPVPGLVRNITGLVVGAVLCLVSVASLQAENVTPCEPLPIARRHVPAPDGGASRTFTVASLNLAGQPRIGDALAEWVHARNIDILLLQEVGHKSIDGGDFAAAVSERLGFGSVYAPATVIDETHTQGLAILSRYPLADVRVLPLTYHRLRFRSRCRIAVVATATIAESPVHLANVHLDTRINSKDRVAQLAPVIETLDGNDAPQLIGGDFNTLNIRWFQTMWPLVFMQKQTAAVGARLAAGGFHTPLKGTPGTFKFPLVPLRLDWVYVKGLTPLEWNVDPVPLTDHKGVWARVSQ